MGSSSTLGLLFEIDADPSKAQSAMQGFAGDAQAAMDSVASSASESASVFTDSTDRIVGGNEKSDYSYTQARLSAMALSEEIGVHAPRAVTTFISHLEGVGPVLAAAFSTVGIIGLIGIMDQLPAALEKITDAFGGWNKAQTETFNELRKDNEEFVKQNAQIYQQLLKIRDIGKTGAALTAQEYKDVNDEIAHLTEENTKLLRQHKEFEEALAKAPTPGAAIYDVVQMQKAEAQMQEITLRLTELQRVAAPKALAENMKAAAEETAKANERQVAYDREMERFNEHVVEEGGAAMKKLAEDDRRWGQFFLESLKAATDGVEELDVRLARLGEESEKKSGAPLLKIGDEAVEGLKKSMSSMTSLYHQLEEAEAKHEQILVNLIAQEISARQRGDQASANSARAQITDLTTTEKKMQEQVDLYAHMAGGAAGMASSVAKAFGDKKAAEIASIVETAVVHIPEEIAAGLGSLAIGDELGAAMHFASAAEYAVVAGAGIAGAAGGSGGGGVSRSEVYGSGSKSAVPLEGGPSPLAPGSAPKTPGVSGSASDLFVVGGSRAYAVIASGLNAHVRSGGGQLSATHAADGSRL